MKKFWIAFVILVLVVGGIFGFFWYSFSTLEESISVDGGVLVWNVGGSYPEERDDSFWGQVRAGGQLTLGEVVFSLHRAAEDDRITGLLMDMRGVGTDWAKLEELSLAVEAFGDAGKPVVAYLDGGSTRDYALAVQADEIVMSPEANLMVLGVVAELSFMKETLDKLGMEADFIHVGKYKSAPERMTRNEASDANREMIEAIVQDRYVDLVDGLARGRGVSAEQVAGWIDQGMFDAQGALSAGLVDTVMYYEEILDRRFATEKTTEMADYVLAPRGKSSARHTVGLVHASGVIMPGESRFDNFQGKIAGSETVVEQLQSVGEDQDVDIVILRIDSPGGSALASDLIWQAIGEVQQTKPVIVSMSGMAASGGYYIACLGDSIFADPGTLTGSIGVYAGKMDRSRMYEKIGVNREFITRGDNALLFSDAGGFSDRQRELFAQQMEQFYERFLAKVAQGRGLTLDQVHAVAQGRVWTGNQGVEHGLVDEIGGLHRAVTSAKWMLGLQSGDKVKIATFGEELSLIERWLLKSLREGGGLARLGASLSGQGPGELGGLTPGSVAALPVVPGLLESLREDGTLAAVSLLDGRPVAMMPFWIRIR
jgi:protease-4